MISSYELYNKIKQSHHTIDQKAWKQITFSEVDDFVNCIKTATPLSSLRTRHPRLTRQRLHFFIISIVNEIDDDVIIIDYVAKLRFYIHNDEKPWLAINEKNDIKTILGTSTIIYSEHGKRIKELYELGCRKAFKYSFWVPLEFQNRTIREIKEGHSLIENAMEFKEQCMYRNRRGVFPVRKYLSYISTYIFDRIGGDCLNDYFTKMIEQCRAECNNPITNDIYMRYVFGFSWLHCHSITNQTDYNRCQIMFLKLVLPYTIPACDIKKNRMAMYKNVCLSDNEIDYLECKYNEENPTARNKRSDILLQELKKLLLPYGHTWQELDNAIKTVFESSQESRILPGYSKVLTALKKNTILNKDLLYISRTPEYRMEFKRIINSYLTRYQELFFASNHKSITQDSSIFIIYYKRNDRYKTLKIDISDLPLLFQMEFRVVMRALSTEQIVSFARILIEFLKFVISQNQLVKSAFDISRNQILLYCLKVDQDGCPSKKRRVLSALKLYYYNLSKNSKSYSELIDITNDLRIKPMIYETTVPIPEEVWILLEKHKDEIIDPQHRLIFDILSETGWRLGEASSIKIDCLYRDSECNAPMIKTIISKTLKSRINNHLDQYSRLCISEELYSKLEKQIQLNEELRHKYNTNLVFFSIIHSKAVKIRCNEFNKAINRLIKMYNITNLDGDQFHYNSRKSRKTVATILINNGAGLSAVQQQLGHTDPVTTAKVYAEVAKLRIAELNNDFFKKKFDYIIGEERLSFFNETERKQLYLDFVFHSRDVDMGICTKHPSEGPCLQNGVTTCARCPKLCVTKNNKREIESRLLNTNQLIQQFESEYKRNEIPYNTYQDFIEYKQVIRDRDAYTKLLKMISHD